MKIYHATVQAGDDGWLVAEVSGLRVPGQRRAGIVTQGRDLDELTFMVRDAIAALTGQDGFAIQLLVPADVARAASPPAPPTRRRAQRRAA